MVLESIIGSQKAEKSPLSLFFLGVLYTSIGAILSLWVFQSQASLIMVSLTVFAAIPLMYKTMRYEEQKDKEIKNEKEILKQHSKALMFFLFLFVGFIFSLSLWYVFLPENLVNSLFSTQMDTLSSINAQVTGQITGNITATGLFMKIFENNFKVLFFCILFSFFYGAGAIFILTWNASVIAAAVGAFVRSNIGIYANKFGLTSLATYFGMISIGIFRYMTHGIFEILAYFIGGLAGGIISVAVINHEVFTPEFKIILKDAFDLFLIAFAILVIAGIIEVFVTPVIFL